jgi:hypothetical protein
MSGPTYNQPASPSYGEGMADALKAQVELLTGTGDFKSTGSLESLLPLEESIRKKTAQTDTDILRQTLLGGTTGGGEQEVTYDDQGRIVIGREEAPGYEIKQSLRHYEGLPSKLVEGFDKDKSNVIRLELYSPEGELLTFVEETPTGDTKGTNASFDISEMSKTLNERVQALDSVPEGFKNQLNNNVVNSGVYTGTSENAGMEITGEAGSYTRVPKSPSFKIGAGEGAPIYAKDTDGNIIQDATKAGTTEVTTLPTQRQGDGMVDLLGDKRNVLDTVAKPDYEQYVRDHSDLLNTFNKEQLQGSTQTIEEYGKKHYEAFPDSPTHSMPVTYEQVDSGRQAGFASAEDGGGFLGLSAFGEDIQAGNLSRQRERDLQDVARLSGTYQDIMEDYKPGTQEALESARSVLESQKDSLTGAGAIGGPQGITDPLSLTSKGFTAAQNTTPVDLAGDTSFTGASVADPMSLTAKTGYDELADITKQKLTAGTTYNPTANVTGSGYTASTAGDLMGLTAGTTYDPTTDVAGSGYTASKTGDPLALTASTSYDPSAGVGGGTFDAATAYKAAQAADPLALSAATSYDPSAGVTGKGYSAVAGLDGGRIKADSLRARLMKDAEAGLDQGLTDREERQIAEAARARSTMMGRTFDQSGAIAEAEARVAEDNARKMQNQAFAQRALGQEADLQQSDLSRGLQAAMQNQAAQNQALQYSSGQDMQAQLANQAATNQALQAGMAAGLSQEALAAQQKQAQEFANMQASNRASEFGVSAGLEQEARANQSALNAALANQQASNQAAQAGMQAGLSQEALKAQQVQTSQLANQQASNRASEFGSTQALNAALANQQAGNRAAEFGVQAGLNQEALKAQQSQAQQFADQQAKNRASEFGSSQALNAALANQQASNRASEFGVQAGLGREQAQAGFAQQANLANLAAEQQRRESGLQAGLNQEQLKANMAQQKAMADAGFTQQARAAELEAGLTQEQAEAQLNQQRLMANQQFSQEANKYGAQEDMQVQLNNLANQISNYQFETGAQMDADRLNEQLKQSGILGYIQAAGGLAALEDSSTLDPFQAVLGRGGGGSLQAGQSVFGQAGYGLNSGPAYLNPESGLGYIQNQATNAANMYNANVAADATKTAGIYGGIGSALGGLGGGLLGNSNLFK